MGNRQNPKTLSPVIKKAPQGFFSVDGSNEPTQNSNRKIAGIKAAATKHKYKDAVRLVFSISERRDIRRFIIDW
jgi:hypothetical protein